MDTKTAQATRDHTPATEPRPERRPGYRDEPPQPGPWAKALILAVEIPLTLMLVPVYWMLNSEGLRSILPSTGRKLSKIPFPGLSLLGDYEWSYRLDLAHIMVIGLFFATLVLTRKMVWGLLTGDTYKPRWLKVPSEQYVQVSIWSGALILAIDALLFYFGAFAQGGPFGQSMLSVSAVLAVSAYAGWVFFVAAIPVWLYVSLS